MDELEKIIAEQDQSIQAGLQSLRSSLETSTELANSISLYNEFKDVESQILKLSRENSNIRSVAIALNEKRKAMLACEDALANLENAVHSEPIESIIPKGRAQ